MKHDDRHRRVLEQLLLHALKKRRLMSYADLRARAGVGYSEDEFGLVMGDLAEKAGGGNPRLPVEWWWSQDTRWYRIKPEHLSDADVML